MPTQPDMSDEELERLEIQDSCTCSICRLGREVIRRREEAKAAASWDPDKTEPGRPSALRIA